MQYGLSEETINRVIKIFGKYSEIDEAILYGSRAKGNFKPGSDIDIAIKGSELNLKILNKINLDIDELLLPYTFDICIYHQIENTDLIDHIERVKKVFYKKSEVV
jgi:uncharacterized protein